MSWDNPEPDAVAVTIVRTDVEYHYVPAGGIPDGATFVNLSEASTLSRTKGQTGINLTVDNLIGGYNYLFRVTSFVNTSSGVVSLQTAEVTALANFPVVAAPTLTVQVDQVATIDFNHSVPDNAPPKRAGDITPLNDAINFVIQMQTTTPAREFDLTMQDLSMQEVVIDATNGLTSGVPWTAAVRYSYPVGGSGDSSAASDPVIPKLPVPDMITLTEVPPAANTLTGGFRFDLTTVDPSISVAVAAEINTTNAGAENVSSDDNMVTVSGSYTPGEVSTGATFSSNELTGGIAYRAYLTPKYTLSGDPIPIAAEHIVGEGVAKSPFGAAPRLPTIQNVAATPVIDGYPLGRVDLMWDNPSDIPGTANDLVGFSLTIMNATNSAANYRENITLDEGSLDSNSFLVKGYIVNYSRLELDREGGTPDAVFPGDGLNFTITPRYKQTGLLNSSLAVAGGPSAEASAAPYAALIRAITADYSSGMVNIDISTVFKYGEISHFNITYSNTDLGVPPTTFIPLSGIPNPADNADNFTLQVAMTRIFPDAVTPSATFQFYAEVVHTGRNMQAFLAGRATGITGEILINRDIDGDGILIGIVASPATPLDECPVEQGNDQNLDFDLDGCKDTADETLAISGPTNPVLVVPADEAAGRTSLDLSWDAADTTQDYYTSFTHYEISIRRHDGGGNTFTLLSSQRVTAVAATTATLSGLAPATTYSVAVRAVFQNTDGVQVFSERSSYSNIKTTISNLVDEDGDGLIEIRTAEQLNNIRYALDGSSYKTSATAAANTTGCPSSGCNGYELEDDISLTAYESGIGWRRVGDRTAGFFGIFEGNDHVIRNLTMLLPNTTAVGFFGALTAGAQVRNVRFEDVNVTGRAEVGGLAGRAYGNSSAGVTIVNTSVEGSVSGSEKTEIGDRYIGGLVGLAGEIGSRGTIIEASFFKGTINVSGRLTTRIGGLVGSDGFPARSAPLDQRIKIRASFARATITSSAMDTSIFIGGLIGQTRRGIIENSYMRGSITAASGATNIGGLAGSAPASSITNSYAVAPITPTTDSNIAGIVTSAGAGSGPTIVTACYWAGVTGAPAAGAGAGARRTPAQMQVNRTADNLYSTWTATCPNDSTKTIWSFAANRYPQIQCTLGGIEAQE